MSGAIQFDCVLYYSTWEIQNLIEMTQLVSLGHTHFESFQEACRC